MLHEHSELVELPVVTHDVLEAKMRIPLLRSGSVSRTPLVNRLRASSSGKVVTVLAPVGYGKTTVLAQWAARDRRPFVWLSIDEDDNDPVILSRDIASALTRGLPADRLVLESLESPGESAPHSLRRLTAAFRSIREPFVLVLDNVHVLRSRKCAAVVASLAEDVTAVGSSLVLAGRGMPRLPIARMRAADRLFEVGVADLALSRREVGLVVRGVGLELGAAEVAELARSNRGVARGDTSRRIGSQGRARDTREPEQRRRR